VGEVVTHFTPLLILSFHPLVTSISLISHPPIFSISLSTHSPHSLSTHSTSFSIFIVAADFALVDDAEMDGNHFEEFTARLEQDEEHTQYMFFPPSLILSFLPNIIPIFLTLF
jgi:hypothetical protein